MLVFCSLFFSVAVTAPPPVDANDLQGGSAWRQQFVAANKDFDRSIQFFEQQTAAHPRAEAAWTNLALAYVDKIPVAGLFAQIALANKAIAALSRSIEIRPTWIAYYVRAQISLYWPRSFGKWRNALADFQSAQQLQDANVPRPYYVRTCIGLGDAYWKSGNLNEAVTRWKEGLAHYPGNRDLLKRVDAEPRARDAYLEGELDRKRRVNTDLSELLK